LLALRMTHTSDSACISCRMALHVATSYYKTCRHPANYIRNTDKHALMGVIGELYLT